MSFAAASGVELADDGRFRGTIAEGWVIAERANGGYLLAILARAMREATGRPDPVSVTGHYLAPGRAGDVGGEVSVVRSGRRFATATAVLRDEDRSLLQAVGTFGALEADATGPERVEGTPPSLPPPDACVAMTPGEGFPPPFMGRVDLRLHPEDAGFISGRPSGRPRVRGWFRFPDAEPVDTIGLLVAVDAFPPTVFNARLPVAWTPTVELTAHVRARPAPGWLACAFSTRFVTGGFLEADGEVWDAGDRLVAQSRQLALMPRPVAPGG